MALGSCRRMAATTRKRVARRGRGRSIFLALVSLLVFSWWQPFADKIPVPCVAADSCSRILERLELKPAFRQPGDPSVFEQALSVSRNEMRHSVPLPHMTVEPEPTIHRVDHSLATLRELDIDYNVWQPIHSRLARGITGRRRRRRCSPAGAARCPRRCSSESGSP